MRDLGPVTFAGTGTFDRLALWRGLSPGELIAKAGGRAVVIPIWRGKVMVEERDDRLTLGQVPPDHVEVRERSADFLLLGRQDGVIFLAVDMSDWVPEEIGETLGAFHDPSRQVHPKFPNGYSFAELRSVMPLLTENDAHIAATAKAIVGWHETHLFCARCGQPSVPAQMGWQRNCPACTAAHFPRTDPVVIMLITHGHDLLLGRSPGWPDGMYSLLAGFVEPGETIEDAVRREVAEETAIAVGPVRYVASQPWPFPSSLMFGCSGTALSREITLDPKELEDAFWMSRSELAAVYDGTSTRIKSPREGAIAGFLMKNWLAGRVN